MVYSLCINKGIDLCYTSTQLCITTHKMSVIMALQYSPLIEYAFREAFSKKNEQMISFKTMIRFNMASQFAHQGRSKRASNRTKFKSSLPRSQCIHREWLQMWCYRWTIFSKMPYQLNASATEPCKIYLYIYSIRVYF